MLIKSYIAECRALLNGNPEELSATLRSSSYRLLASYILALVFGCGLYGASVGLWRDPIQGIYSGIKMPLLIGLTLMVNGLLNGMLAQILGSGLSFKQTFTAFIMCFSIFGMIVGSCSPIVFALLLDSPTPNHGNAEEWYRVYLLIQTAVIGLAGIVANYKLMRLLVYFSGNEKVAIRTLFAWLASNLFVGAQLSYIFRPFFGNPTMPVEFIRKNPFDGNFYEVVGDFMAKSLGGNTAVSLLIVALLLMIFFIALVVNASLNQNRKLKNNS